jgi:hypothetical protein
MKRTFLFTLLLLLTIFNSYSQQRKLPLTISIFTNASSLPPGVVTQLFSEPLHPGIHAGTYFKWNSSLKHELFQTAKLGYFYHRYSQHAIQAFTETGYRFNFGKGFSVGPLLGGGYLHSIPDTQIFNLGEDGMYKKQNKWGRPQAMATTALEGSYTIRRDTDNPIRLFVNYQFWFQFPFVRQYVPVLPSTALHFGLSLPVSR